MANAGHLAPFLNNEEMSLPGALPLGLDPDFYTDGLLEARNAAGEIFSFERLRALIATAPDARQAAESAVAFGQEDDITVITLTTPRDRSDVHHFAVGARINKFRGLEAAQWLGEGSGIRFRLGVECSTIR